MKHEYFIIWITVVAIVSFVYLLKEKVFSKFFKIERQLVSVKNAKLSLDKIASWTTWITSLQTGAIASMAFLLKNDLPNSISLTQKHYAFFSILFFGSSIILSAWILSSIPSITQRLPNNDENESFENDIYEFKIYSFSRFKLGPFTSLVHWYFLIGIVFFSLFIYSFI